MRHLVVTLAVLALVSGCYREGRVNTSFSEVETPNGIETVKVTSGPNGSDVVRKSTSSPQFRDCLRNVSSTKGSDEADAYCRNWTSGSVGSPLMGNSGTIPVQLNTGSYAQVTPWNGSPTYAVGFPQPAPTPAPVSRSGRAPDGKAIGALVRELDRQAADICALKRSQDLPCDEK